MLFNKLKNSFNKKSNLKKNALYVGALTNKPFKFKYRSWELSNFYSLDFTNSYLNEVIYSYNLKECLFKVQSYKKWITNNTRFGAEGLKFKSILNTLGFDKNIVKFGLYVLFIFFCKKVFKWNYSFNAFLNEGIVGESIILIKNFMNSLGSSFITYRTFGDYNYNLNLNNDVMLSYNLNIKIKDINKMDGCLLIGMDPRLENPLLNVEFRKNYISGNYNNKFFYSFGNIYNSTYNINVLGVSSKSLYNFLEGKHKYCSKIIKLKKPLILLGTGIFTLKDSSKIINNFQSIVNYVSLIQVNKGSLVWNGLGFLGLNNLDNISRELNLVNKVNLNKKNYNNNIYLLFNNNIFNKYQLRKLLIDKSLLNRVHKPLIIYFGSYNNIILKKLSLVVFNIKSIIEDSGTLLTLDGFSKKIYKNEDKKVFNKIFGKKKFEENSLFFIFICFSKFFFKKDLLNKNNFNNDFYFSKILLRYSGFLNLNVKSLRNNIIEGILVKDQLILNNLFINIFNKNDSYINQNIINSYNFDDLFINNKLNSGVTNIYNHSNILLENFFINEKKNRNFI